MKKKKAFLICPVREHGPAEFERVVEIIENELGYDLHFPHRDTDQDDPTGLRICRDNRAAIEEADIIFIIWDGESQGSLFDLGMAFMARKKLFIWKVPLLTEGKSFQNMMTAWANEGPGH